MRLSSRRGKRKWTQRCGYKPEPTTAGKNKGVLLAALRLWELRQDGYKQPTQWDVVKAKQLIHASNARS